MVPGTFFAGVFTVLSITRIEVSASCSQGECCRLPGSWRLVVKILADVY